jgi:hypothetical protein
MRQFPSSNFPERQGCEAANNDVEGLSLSSPALFPVSLPTGFAWLKGEACLGQLLSCGSQEMGINALATTPLIRSFGE